MVEKWDITIPELTGAQTRRAVRNGAYMGVDVRFELVDQPFHGDLAPAGDLAESGIPKGEGGVLFQAPVVRAVVALHRGNDQGGYLIRSVKLGSGTTLYMDYGSKEIFNHKNMLQSFGKIASLLLERPINSFMPQLFPYVASESKNTL